MKIAVISTGYCLDGRIGKKFLFVGLGYGGSCFSSYTLAFARTSQEKKSPISIIESVIKSNDMHKKNMVEKIRLSWGDFLQRKKIGILGVTFKPNTNDMREALSLGIIIGLQAIRAIIRAYNPVGMEEAQKYLDDVIWYHEIKSCLEGMNAAIILAEWTEFRPFDWHHFQKTVKILILIDLRNVYISEEILNHGFNYLPIGCKPMVSLKKNKAKFA